jgi:aspartyl-tRNA(Asn)/glutamyl-tRNA(Gln) amidotransferase subunit A
MGSLGIETVEVELPGIPTTVQAPEVYAIHVEALRHSPELFQPWMRDRLQQATSITTLDYVNGRRALEEVRRSIMNVFNEVELLVTPTVPVPPITIEEASMMSPPLAGEVWLRNTRPFNAYALPTISIPCGFTENGLPIGLQISAPKYHEEMALALAYKYEQATEWHKVRPGLWEENES